MREARETGTEALHAALGAGRLTLATAESLTGGGLAEAVSAVPGASATFRGGVVAYATDVKVRVLGVRAATVSAHGVVSADCAAEMAENVRTLLGADVGVATTGVAGPEPQEGKPVGLVHVGVATDAGTRTTQLHLSGDRAEIRAAVVRSAVSAVLRTLADRDV